MKTRITLIIAAFAALILGACNQVSYKKTKGGLPYKIFSTGNGVKVDTNNFVKLHYTSKLNDSVMVTTFGKLPIYFQVTGGQMPYDISEIFFQFRKGDSIVAVQEIDTFMKRNPGQLPPQFKKGDKLYTHIKVLDVFKTQAESAADEEKSKKEYLAVEIKEVENYLAKNNIKATKTRSGAFVEIIEPGTGPEIDSGNYVMAFYKGTSFSGKVFDTNMDSSFGHYGATSFIPGTVGRPGASIPGFDEGLQMLRGGSKARIYIPSLLAYGPNSGSPDIKPFEHLIFDIVIDSVAAKPPAEMTQQRPPEFHPIDTTGR